MFLLEDLVVEYDQNRIFSFFGFNEAPAGFDDESETYGVRRYSEEMSREKFLSTLNLEKVLCAFYFQIQFWICLITEFLLKP